MNALLESDIEFKWFINNSLVFPSIDNFLLALEVNLGYVQKLTGFSYNYSNYANYFWHLKSMLLWH